MPFVRKHGHQVAIVHGERDADTRQVQQRVLFSLYSKPEADAALGLCETDPPLSFRSIVQSGYGDVSFDWSAIDARIAELKGELPDTYAYPTVGVAPALRSAAVEFARALLTADPQSTSTAARAIRDQRRELAFLRDVIDASVQLCDRKDDGMSRLDNEFGWLSRRAGRGIPYEAREWLDGLIERGDDDQTEAVAGLLVEAWPDFADGHNVIGGIALDHEDYDRALACFQRAMTVGRTLFPKRIAKSRWWGDHATRPYIRAMRSTASALQRSGRYDEVLVWGDRLEQECHDKTAADVFRAPAFLCLGRFGEAHAAAAPYGQLWPDEAFIAAFASFELGDLDDALARWLHAAIRHPRAARMLTGKATKSRPNGMEEARDHNAGVYLTRDLAAYLKRKGARRFFGAVTLAPAVVALIEERAEAVAAWHADRGPDRTAFTRMQEMETLAFAREQAAILKHLMGRAR